ncbi:response regulator, partial [Pseudomonas sp. 79_C]
PLASLDILVVEDVALNREVAGGLLLRDGHRVSFAEDAGQALLACAQRRFDLILLDVHLPGMSGVELCRQIRATPGPNRHSRILALTAGVQPGQVPGYLAAGMQGVLAKPLRLDNLRQALAEAAPTEVAGADATMDWSLLDTHRSLLG